VQIFPTCRAGHGQGGLLYVFDLYGQGPSLLHTVYFLSGWLAIAQIDLIS